MNTTKSSPPLWKWPRNIGMKWSVLLCLPLLLQACATRTLPHDDVDNSPLMATSELGRRLYEIHLLNQGHTEKVKRLMEMDINALLIVLHEYDKNGDLSDEAKATYEAAKKYRRQHPFKVSSRDEVDFPRRIFNADDDIQQIISEKDH
jgi:hypothetical protein